MRGLWRRRARARSHRTRERVLCLVECIEDVLFLIGLNPDAGVGDCDDGFIMLVVVFDAGVDFDVPLGGELDGVVDEFFNDLCESFRLCDDLGIARIVNVCAEFEPACDRFCLCALDARREDICHASAGGVDAELAGLDRGHVEHGSDEFLEMASGFVY